MIYINRKTGTRIALTDVPARDRTFFRDAVRRFRRNAPWAEFEDFAFGMGSPIYSLRVSPLEVVKDPLYVALKDMWLELGVRQGLVAERTIKERHNHAPRRSQSRSREAANRQDVPEYRKLAASNSSARSHS